MVLMYNTADCCTGVTSASTYMANMNAASIDYADSTVETVKSRGSKKTPSSSISGRRRQSSSALFGFSVGASWSETRLIVTFFQSTRTDQNSSAKLKGAKLAHLAWGMKYKSCFFSVTLIPGETKDPLSGFFGTVRLFSIFLQRIYLCCKIQLIYAVKFDVQDLEIYGVWFLFGAWKLLWFFFKIFEWFYHTWFTNDCKLYGLKYAYGLQEQLLRRQEAELWVDWRRSW